jgi:hypothetical protein
MRNSEDRVVEERGEESLVSQFHYSLAGFKCWLEIKLKPTIKGHLVPAESSATLCHSLEQFLVICE